MAATAARRREGGGAACRLGRGRSRRGEAAAGPGRAARGLSGPARLVEAAATCGGPWVVAGGGGRVRRPADVSGRAERVDLGFRARGSANFEEGVYI